MMATADTAIATATRICAVRITRGRACDVLSANSSVAPVSMTARTPPPVPTPVAARQATVRIVSRSVRP